MIIIALIISLLNIIYGIYIFKNKKLSLIASIEPQKVPGNKVDSLLKCYLYVMILTSILLFLTIYYMEFNIILGIIFITLVFLSLSIFYIYYVKLIK